MPALSSARRPSRGARNICARKVYAAHLKQLRVQIKLGRVARPAALLAFGRCSFTDVQGLQLGFDLRVALGQLEAAKVEGIEERWLAESSGPSLPPHHSLKRDACARPKWLDAGSPMSMTQPMTALTRGQYAPLLHRSSPAQRSTLPYPACLCQVFLRYDFRRGRADYFANPAPQLHPPEPVPTRSGHPHPRWEIHRCSWDART